MIALQAFPWPDNLRQLRETIRLTLEATSSQTIDVADLPVAIRTFPSHVIQDHAIPEMFLDKAIEDFERHLIQAAVKAFPRNRAKAARYLNISRTRLLRRIEQLKIEVDESQVPDFDVFLRSSKDLTNSLEYQSDITNRVKEKTTSKKQDDTTSSFETHEPIDFKELPHDSE